MAWPWARFEAMYTSHCKRKAVEEAREVKNAMISGLWSNANFDDDKGTRTKALEEIEESFQTAILSVYDESYEEPQIDWDDPFFSSMKLPNWDDVPEQSANLPTTTTDYDIDQA